MPKRRLYSGVIDPITIIGVLFLIVTLAVGTYVARDTGFSLNINENAATNSCNLCLKNVDNPDECYPSPCGGGNDGGIIKPPSQCKCGVKPGGGCKSCNEEEQPSNPAPPVIVNPQPIQQPASCSQLCVQNATPDECGCLTGVATTFIIPPSGQTGSNASTYFNGNPNDDYVGIINNPVIEPTPTQHPLYQECKDVYDRNIPENAVVVYGGEGSYKKCVNGLWTSDCGGRTCVISDLTSSYVPTYLEEEYADSIKYEFSELVIICDEDGGTWDPLKDVCSYPNNNVAANNLESTITYQQNQGKRCVGTNLETWNGSNWDVTVCANGCKNNSCALPPQPEIIIEIAPAVATNTQSQNANTTSPLSENTQTGVQATNQYFQNLIGDLFNDFIPGFSTYTNPGAYGNYQYQQPNTATQQSNYQNNTSVNIFDMIATRFNNALSNSGMQNTGTYGLGGGNAYVAPVPINIVTSQDRNAINNYISGNTLSFSAGFTTAAAIATAPLAFQYAPQAINTVMNIRYIPQILTVADALDSTVTGVACKLGNEDACSYFAASVAIPGFTSQNMLTDTIDDFTQAWSGVGNRALDNIVDNFISPNYFDNVSIGQIDNIVPNTPTNTLIIEQDIASITTTNSLTDTVIDKLEDIRVVYNGQEYFTNIDSVQDSVRAITGNPTFEITQSMGLVDNLGNPYPNNMPFAPNPSTSWSNIVQDAVPSGQQIQNVAETIMDDLSNPLPTAEISNPVSIVNDWLDEFAANNIDNTIQTGPQVFDVDTNGLPQATTINIPRPVIDIPRPIADAFENYVFSSTGGILPFLNRIAAPNSVVDLTLTPTTPLTTRVGDWLAETFGGIGGPGSPAIDPTLNAQSDIQELYNLLPTIVREKIAASNLPGNILPTIETPQRTWSLVTYTKDPNLPESAIDEILDQLMHRVLQGNSNAMIQPKDTGHIVIIDIEPNRYASIATIRDVINNYGEDIVKQTYIKYGLPVPDEIKLADYFMFGVSNDTTMTFKQIGGVYVQITSSPNEPVIGAQIATFGKDLPENLKGDDFMPIIVSDLSDNAQLSKIVPGKNAPITGRVLSNTDIANLQPIPSGATLGDVVTDSLMVPTGSKARFETFLSVDEWKNDLTPEQFELIKSLSENQTSAVNRKIDITWPDATVVSVDVSPYSQISTAIRNRFGSNSPEANGLSEIVMNWFERMIVKLGKDGNFGQFGGDGFVYVSKNEPSKYFLSNLAESSGEFKRTVLDSLNSTDPNIRKAAEFISENFEGQFYTKIGIAKTKATFTFIGGGKYTPLVAKSDLDVEGLAKNTKNYRANTQTPKDIIIVHESIANSFSQRELRNMGLHSEQAGDIFYMDITKTNFSQKVMARIDDLFKYINTNVFRNTMSTQNIAVNRQQGQTLVEFSAALPVVISVPALGLYYIDQYLDLGIIDSVLNSIDESLESNSKPISITDPAYDAINFWTKTASVIYALNNDKELSEISIPNPNQRPYDEVIQEGINNYITNNPDSDVYYETNPQALSLFDIFKQIFSKGSLNLIYQIFNNEEYKELSFTQKLIRLPEMHGLNGNSVIESVMIAAANTRLFTKQGGMYPIEGFDDETKNLIILIENEVQTTSQPVSHSFVIEYFLEKNEGDLTQAILDSSNFEEYIFRGWGREMVDNPYSWVRDHVLDEYSPILPYQTLPTEEVRLENSEIYYDYSLQNRLGVVYHSANITALLNYLPPEAIKIMVIGEYIVYGNKHGLIKLSADLEVLKQLDDINDLLNTYNNQ